MRRVTTASRRRGLLLVAVFALACLALPAARAADHNDPNAVNSIFSDIPLSAADLYDLFGYPSDDRAGGEKVVLALTFAPVPNAGLLDPDLLYKVRVTTAPRLGGRLENEGSLAAARRFADAVRDRYVNVEAAEIRVRPAAENEAKVDFLGFASGPFSTVVRLDTSNDVPTPDGHVIKLFVGGRDDAFFNDLPGFFRSINYAPQFYFVPLSAPVALRELPIPKTLLELEGNELFNFDPKDPQHGSGVKHPLPPGPYGWAGNSYRKDQNGNFRFVYSGRDAQAGRNINAIVLEIPLGFLTKKPETNRIVNAWGESWVRKSSIEAQSIPDRGAARRPFWSWLLTLGLLVAGGVLLGKSQPKTWKRRLAIAVTALGVVAGVVVMIVFRSSTSSFPDRELADYKLVDTDGLPFADAGLSEREDERQLGANNSRLGLFFVKRFGHLGWGFAPSVSALGLATCFDHGDAPVPVYKTYSFALAAFPRVKKCFFQKLNMPDDSWNPKRLDIPLRRPFEVFIPNVCAVDMDTTGSWPFGRRLEDQVATRFLSVFLDHTAQLNGKPYNLDTLADQALWDAAPIEPKTPPNPLYNDKPFLSRFPYLAEPWPENYGDGTPYPPTAEGHGGAATYAPAPGSYGGAPASPPATPSYGGAAPSPSATPSAAGAATPGPYPAPTPR